MKALLRLYDGSISSMKALPDSGKELEGQEEEGFEPKERQLKTPPASASVIVLCTSKASNPSTFRSENHTSDGLQNTSQYASRNAASKASKA